MQAHRQAWLDAGREIPPGLCVLHRCDVPACVNVEHLFLGTRTDNFKDSVNKGRFWSLKRRQHMERLRKLTDEQVAEIRGSDLTHGQLARKYGVERSYVSRLKRGERRR